MPRFVALDWDDQQVRAVFASLQGGTLSIDDAVNLPIPQDPSGEGLHNLTSTVRDAVVERRYKSAEALITIRRGEVELRLLNLPPVPEEELPDIVRFQALQDFSEISEDWPIDFLPVESSSTDELTVLAAAVSAARVNQIRAAASDAELKPHALVLRPCAAAALVRHQKELQRDRVQLMVDDFGSGIELTVMKEQTATFIRTVQKPPASNRLNSLAGEIRRTIVAAQNQLGGEQVQRVILFGSGDEHNDFCQQLESTLELPVNSIDPFSGFQLSRDLQARLPVEPERFAGALGLLIQQVDDGPGVIDFFNPRRVEPPKSRRPLILGALTACLTVTALTAGGCWWYLKSIDKDITRLKIAAQNLRQESEAAQKQIDEYLAVGEWQRRDVNWLDQLREVSNELPDASAAIVRNLRAGVVTSGNGVITLEGVVDQQSTIARLERNLRDDKHRVMGEGGLYEKRVKDYPWRFKETIVIETGDPKQKQSQAGPNRAAIYSRESRSNRATP